MTRSARSAAIVGTGYSKVARHIDVPLGKLAHDAARAAAEQAGISLDQIDGLSAYPSPSRPGAGAIDGIDLVSAQYLAGTLGLRDLRWSSSILPGSFVGSVIAAAHALTAGACEYVLAWRAMHTPVGARYERNTAELEHQFTAPYGLSDNLSAFAMPYSRYLARYGATREDMAAFILSNRKNAALNPDAVFYGKPITREDYLSSKMLVAPLSILDCDMPVDGCGAVIVTTADRARGAAVQPAYVAGCVSMTSPYGGTLMHTLERFEEVSSVIADSLWRSSGMSARDVDQPDLYDGFSWFTYLWLEAFGFCPRGEAARFIQDGRIELTGELPINTSGGALGMGRLHGAPQLIEAVRQIQGTCGARQVPDVNVTLAVNGNPMLTPGAILFTRDP